MLFLSLLIFSVLPISNESEEQQVVAEFAKQRPGEFLAFYKSLFADCDDAQLVALTSIGNDSIATQAAWKRVHVSIRACSGKAARQRSVTWAAPKEERRGMLPVDVSRLAWFVGFLEGRNRIVAPEWWRTIVLGSQANPQNRIYPGTPKKRPYHKTKLKWAKCPVDASLEEDERKSVTYRVGDDSILIPEKLVTRLDSGEVSGNISAAFTESHCFATVHSTVGYPHDVACIDRSTGKMVWTAKACGCWSGGYSGRGESCVELIPTKDGRVFVFGYSSIGIYVHGFDVATGKTIVRFTSHE